MLHDWINPSHWLGLRSHLARFCLLLLLSADASPIICLSKRLRRLASAIALVCAACGLLCRYERSIDECYSRCLFCFCAAVCRVLRVPLVLLVVQGCSSWLCLTLWLSASVCEEARGGIHVADPRGTARGGEAALPSTEGMERSQSTRAYLGQTRTFARIARHSTHEH